MAKKSKAAVVPKAEIDKSMRGTVSLFKNTKTGLTVYVRGKKVFMRNPKYPILGSYEIDHITAAYAVRREYADAQQTPDYDLVKGHPKLIGCKSGAVAALTLERMLNRGSL